MEGRLARCANHAGNRARTHGTNIRRGARSMAWNIAGTNTTGSARSNTWHIADTTRIAGGSIAGSIAGNIAIPLAESTSAGSSAVSTAGANDDGSVNTMVIITRKTKSKASRTGGDSGRSSARDVAGRSVRGNTRSMAWNMGGNNGTTATREAPEFGSPEESITLTKRERLRAIASHYRQTHNDLPSLWRIDVGAVELNQKGKLSRIELIENAVGDA